MIMDIMAWIGVLAVVSVVGALFFPDWPRPDERMEYRASPGSDDFVVTVAGVIGTPVYRGGQATVLQNGDAFYAAMLEAIRGARDTITFEVYIFEPDEIGRRFLDAFIERARNGVEVRLLFDWFGSIRFKKKYVRELRDAGIKVEFFRPLALRNLVRIYRRSHRRAIVIDGEMAFTGGAAISKKWVGDAQHEEEWRDSMTRVTGHLVTGIQAAFTTNWVYCTGEVLAGPRYFPAHTSTEGAVALSVVSSPSDAMQPIRMLYWMSFASARKRLWIASSYFIPDHHFRNIARERARAGVDVRILVPGKHTDAIPVKLAGQCYYEELLRDRVRVFEFQPSMMHAKTIVVDDAWTLIGSANMDERSMELNEENALGIKDEGFASAVAAGNEQDFARSREIHLEEWLRRPWYHRVIERAAEILLEQY
jgi:cardiolipin synthase A/B